MIGFICFFYRNLIRFFCSLLALASVILPPAAAENLTSLSIMAANFDGSKSIEGEQIFVDEIDSELGFTFNVQLTPTASDVSDTVENLPDFTVLIMEIGSYNFGSGLYLVDGVPTFIVNGGGTDTEPDSLNDLSFYDVCIQSSHGPLEAGIDYSIAVEWHPEGNLNLIRKKSGQAEITETFTLTYPGNIPWAGNRTVSVGTISDQTSLGGLSGRWFRFGRPFDYEHAKGFQGTIPRALFWNASAQQFTKNHQPFSWDSELRSIAPLSVEISDGMITTSIPALGFDSSAAVWRSYDLKSWEEVMPIQALSGLEPLQIDHVNSSTTSRAFYITQNVVTQPTTDLLLMREPALDSEGEPSIIVEGLMDLGIASSSHLLDLDQNGTVDACSIYHAPTKLGAVINFHRDLAERQSRSLDVTNRTSIQFSNHLALTVDELLPVGSKQPAKITTQDLLSGIESVHMIDDLNQIQKPIFGLLVTPHFDDASFRQSMASQQAHSDWKDARRATGLLNLIFSSTTDLVEIFTKMPKTKADVAKWVVKKLIAPISQALGANFTEGDSMMEALVADGIACITSVGLTSLKTLVSATSLGIMTIPAIISLIDTVATCSDFFAGLYQRHQLGAYASGGNFQNRVNTLENIPYYHGFVTSNISGIPVGVKVSSFHRLAYIRSVIGQCLELANLNRVTGGDPDWKRLTDRIVIWQSFVQNNLRVLEEGRKRWWDFYAERTTPGETPVEPTAALYYEEAIRLMKAEIAVGEALMSPK